MKPSAGRVIGAATLAHTWTRIKRTLSTTFQNATHPYTAWVALLLPLVVPCVKQVIVLRSPLFPTPLWATLHLEFICCALAFDVWAVATVFAGRYVAGGGVWQTADQMMVYPDMPVLSSVDAKEGLTAFLVFTWHLVLLGAAAKIVPNGLPLDTSGGYHVSATAFGLIIVTSILLSYGPCTYLITRRP